MSTRIVGILFASALATTAGLAQQPPGRFPLDAVKPAESSAAPRDLDKYSPLERHLYLTAVRGADWLQRANQPDGRFVPGFHPSLGIKAEGEAFLSQVEATAALLRAARILGDERALALGKQALLRVLQETTADQTQQVRFTAAPEAMVNRVAACGSLLAAIHELPQPGEDLAAQSRQLSLYLQRQIRSDGTFNFATDDQAVARHLIRTSTGPALLGLVRAEKNTPAAAAVRRVCLVHAAHWRQEKHPAPVAALSSACAEAFLASGEPALAQVVFEINDWLLSLQYPSDGQRSAWSGGFTGWHEGRAASLPPDAGTAALARSLVEACRVARHTGDVARLERYRAALEAALRFVASLQYTEARVQHFADWYRPWIVGGFHHGMHDGDLRLADNHEAVVAFLGYVEHVSGLPR